MEFFRQNTNIDFMGLRKWAAMLSAILFIASIIGLTTKGLNWGLDFTGGNQIEVTYPQSADLGAIRDVLHGAGFSDAVVVNFGSTKDVQITLRKPKQGMDLQQQAHAVVALLKKQNPRVRLEQVNFIGSQVSSQLATKGALAIVIAIIAILIYIAMRFEIRFAISAVVALLHDPILILGFFAWFHWEFNLTVLAALLAVIGYSLNDTVVIFDRIRENFRKIRKGSPPEVVNISVNQTLSRTVMTSGLTLLVVLALFFVGGEVIHGFSIALIIGIVIGTYSSIYVAGSLAVALGLNRADFLPKAKVVDDRP